MRKYALFRPLRLLACWFPGWVSNLSTLALDLLGPAYLCKSPNDKEAQFDWQHHRFRHHYHHHHQSQ